MARIQFFKKEDQSCYLDPKQGLLFHPHLQAVVEDIPTTSHKKVLEGINRYQENGESSFWQDYLLEETRRNDCPPLSVLTQ